MYEKFIEELAEKLKGSLPGSEAQYKMASQFRLPSDMVVAKKRNARQGGVLIAIFPEDNSPHTVLMQRTSYRGVHSGQVSFPGGRYEEQDEDISQTALREAEEEVGIPQPKVKLIGQLTELYIPPSNFLVHPFIGLLDEKPHLRPEEKEVEKILTVPLDFFFDTERLGEKDIEVRGGYKIRAPYFDVHGHVVWGATAMIISEFRELLDSMESYPHTYSR